MTCDYCRNWDLGQGKLLVSQPNITIDRASSGDPIVHVEHGLDTDTGSLTLYLSFEINHCPMCGEQLRDVCSRSFSGDTQDKIYKDLENILYRVSEIHEINDTLWAGDITTAYEAVYSLLDRQRRLDGVIE